MRLEIALIPGDGVGPEIVDAARQVLDMVAHQFGHQIHYTEVLAGGISIDRYGLPLIDEELEKARGADAVLLGAVGGPKWDTLPGNLRPERALLQLRKNLGLYANLRPARLYSQLADACPLKHCKELDFLIVRELTGGIYFGEHGRDADQAFDVMKYSVSEIERIAHTAFQVSLLRKCHVTSVDKANVLESSRLWREVMHRVSKEYPQVFYDDILVDNCAMQFLRNPAQFDVIVTSNMFGDILSDEASMLTGSIGLLPSASIGNGTRGMFEPIHGSAPDIAGKGIANPIATILSAAMLLRYSFHLFEEAESIEHAVEDVLSDGLRTADITNKDTFCSTKEMCQAILKRIHK